MFRNQYDSDVSIWSPQGRLHQVDYAVEAMKQGTATVGIKSKTHAVIVALKRAFNEFSLHQEKIYELDTHAGLSMAGILSDGRILARFLQEECASFKFDYKTVVPIYALNKKLQLTNTQNYGRRPFAVGLLIAGYDDNGPHIVKSDPSADVVEMLASSIGARSQSARTYLEKHLADFVDCSLEQLVVYALNSLIETLPPEESLNVKNTSIAIVGKGQPFKNLNIDEIYQYLSLLTPETSAPTPSS